MKELEIYLQKHNIWRGIEGKPDFTPENLRGFDLLEMRQSVEGDLSPENLTCDGELSEEEVGYKVEFLLLVREQLDRLKCSL